MELGPRHVTLRLPQVSLGCCARGYLVGCLGSAEAGSGVQPAGSPRHFACFPAAASGGEGPSASPMSLDVKRTGTARGTQALGLACASALREKIGIPFFLLVHKAKK
jgi:hypothetical protein